MKNDESVLDILRDLIAEDVVKYAIAKEWRKDLDSERHKKFIVLSHNSHKDEQLPVPRDENANDYAKRMKEVIGVLAETEARTKEAVIKDILAFRADVLQYRVISRATQKGSIPISEAISLLEGAKNALLSSACSVLSPSRKHTRLANSANEKKLISACELGQTERGSYVISLICPLYAIEGRQPLLANTIDPFTRKTTLRLMESLDIIAKSAASKDLSKILSPQTDETTISSNLCDSILRMFSTSSGGQLEICASWAASLKPSNPPVSTVMFNETHIDEIRNISNKLKYEEELDNTLYHGEVEGIRRKISNPSDTAFGDVTIRVLVANKSITVNLTLTVLDWNTAHLALGSGRAVCFNATLFRDGNKWKADNVRDFRMS